MKKRLTIDSQINEVESSSRGNSPEKEVTRIDLIQSPSPLKEKKVSFNYN